MPSTYYVRVNGQTIGPLDAAELESRSAKWRQLGIAVEAAETGSQTFVPIAQVLAALRSAPAATQVLLPGPWDVRINGQSLGRLDRAEIESRAPRWRRVGARVEIAAGGGGFTALDAFLAALPSPNVTTAPIAAVRPGRTFTSRAVHAARGLVGRRGRAVALVAAAVLVAVTAVVFVRTCPELGGLNRLCVSEDRLWAAMAEGNTHFEADRYDEAIASFTALIRRAPKFKQAHAALGHALVGAQRYPDAIAAYTKAIELDPDYPGPYLGRGWTRWFTGQLPAAVEDYRHLVRLEPDNVDFHLEFERVLYEIGRPMEIAEMWGAFSRRNPDVTNAKFWRIRALAKAEAWSTLAPEVRDLASQKPFSESAYVQYLHARALNEAGAHRDALDPLRRAVDLVRGATPVNKGALQEYGDELVYTYVWAGDIRKAQEWERQLKQELG